MEEESWGVAQYSIFKDMPTILLIKDSSAVFPRKTHFIVYLEVWLDFSYSSVGDNYHAGHKPAIIYP